MTLPLALDDGKLRVPASGRGPGDLIADGFRDIGPDDADYDDWVAYMQASGRPTPPNSRDERGDWIKGEKGLFAGSRPGPGGSGGSHLGYSGLAKAAQAGGFSVSLIGDVPKTGYMVSPYKNAEEVFDAATFTKADVHAYRDAHRDVLRQPDHYLGGWRDGDRIYLDVSIHASTRSEASALARQHGQLAYFDLDAGVSVPTEEP